MFRLQMIIVLLIASLPLFSQEQIVIDRDYDEFIAHGVISSDNILTAIHESEKSGMEPPFSIEITYQGSACNAELNSIYVSNCKFPLFWYEITESGEKMDPLINPKPAQLMDHTTYVVEDSYFNSDTVYVDFIRSFEFQGLHPNPTVEQAVLKYISFNSLPVTIALYNVKGEILFSDEMVFDESQTELAIDLRNFTPGTYFLNVRCECMQQTIKFVNAGF